MTPVFARLDSRGGGGVARYILVPSTNTFKLRIILYAHPFTVTVSRLSVDILTSPSKPWQRSKIGSDLEILVYKAWKEPEWMTNSQENQLLYRDFFRWRTSTSKNNRETTRLMGSLWRREHFKEFVVQWGMNILNCTRFCKRVFCLTLG